LIAIWKATIRDVSTIVGLWKEFMHYHDNSVLKKNQNLREYTCKKKNASDNFRNYLKKKLQSGITLMPALSTISGDFLSTR